MEKFKSIEEDTKLSSKGSIKEVFTEFSKPLFVGISLAFFMQYNGVNAVTFYSNQIFEKAGADNTTLFTFIVNAL